MYISGAMFEEHCFNISKTKKGKHGKWWIKSTTFICKFAVYYSPCHRVASVSIVSPSSVFFCQQIVSKLSGVVCSLFSIRKSTWLSFMWLPLNTSNRARSAKYKSVICETGHFWTFVILFVQKSSQSSKSSFRKIQIFEFTNSTLPLSYSLLQIFEFTNSTLPLFYSSFRLSHGGIWLLWYLIC